MESAGGVARADHCRQAMFPGHDRGVGGDPARSVTMATIRSNNGVWSGHLTEKVKRRRSVWIDRARPSPPRLPSRTPGVRSSRHGPSAASDGCRMDGATR
jgi:hypothetical protein